MVYGYGRVSTKGQAKDGNSLEAQERLLKKHGAEVIYMDSWHCNSKHLKNEKYGVYYNIQVSINR